MTLNVLTETKCHQTVQNANLISKSLGVMHLSVPNVTHLNIVIKDKVYCMCGVIIKIHVNV